MKLLQWHNYRDPEWIAERERGFWFRILGRGLHFSNRPRSAALFSERYGYCKVWYVRGIRIEYLPKREAK